MTQSTVSKHSRKVLRIRLASIPPGPPHRVTIIQHICSMTRYTQKKTNINTMNLGTVNGRSETKPNPENCKNCSSKCAYDCAQLQYTIHSTEQF